jgi:hypothetical protein
MLLPHLARPQVTELKSSSTLATTPSSPSSIGLSSELPATPDSIYCTDCDSDHAEPYNGSGYEEESYEDIAHPTPRVIQVCMADIQGDDVRNGSNAGNGGNEPNVLPSSVPNSMSPKPRWRKPEQPSRKESLWWQTGPKKS